MSVGICGRIKGNKDLPTPWKKKKKKEIEDLQSDTLIRIFSMGFGS